MKVVTLKSLKLFLNYLKKNLVAPFATRDGEGNVITDTYLRLHGKADAAARADSAATAETCTGSAAEAAQAEKLRTAREIRLAGDVSGAVKFNGSEDVVIQTQADAIMHAVDAIRGEMEQKAEDMEKGISDEKLKLHELQAGFQEQAEELVEAGRKEQLAAVSDARAGIEAMFQKWKDAYEKENAYSQTTKLEAAALKGIDIPVKESLEQVRSPFQVLKLKDDGMTRIASICDFTNGDASDFVNTDAYLFLSGRMKLRDEFDVPMSEQKALGSGFVSSTDMIDLEKYEDLKEVKIL